MDGLAAPVLRRPAPLDPPVVLEAIEESGQGCPLDPHSLGDFLLSEIISALGKMHEGAPLALAQAEGTEALVKPGAPGPGGPEKDEAKFVDVRWRHDRDWLAC